MPLRPPRKCSTDGAGMVIFGVTLVCAFTNLKCSRNGWLEKPTLPVTRTPRCLVSTPANWMPWSDSKPSTPSRPSRKSKCHQARRYSPSVTSCMPMSSCFLISFSISVSSTFFRSAAVMSPFSRLARALVAQRELQIADREARMLAHDRLGARAFAVLDRPHDAAMVVLRDGHHHARLGQFGLDAHERVGRGEGEIERTLELARQHR